MRMGANLSLCQRADGELCARKLRLAQPRNEVRLVIHVVPGPSQRRRPIIFAAHLRVVARNDGFERPV